MIRQFYTVNKILKQIYQDIFHLNPCMFYNVCTQLWMDQSHKYSAASMLVIKIIVKFQKHGLSNSSGSLCWCLLLKDIKQKLRCMMDVVSPLRLLPMRWPVIIYGALCPQRPGSDVRATACATECNTRGFVTSLLSSLCRYQIDHH